MRAKIEEITIVREKVTNNFWRRKSSGKKGEREMKKITINNDLYYDFTDRDDETKINIKEK